MDAQKKSFKERLAVLGIGFTANALTEYIFEWTIYPFVIYKLGTIMGGGVMIIASFMLCLATFLFYDWAKKDWFGIEALKEAQDIPENPVLGLEIQIKPRSIPRR